MPIIVEPITFPELFCRHQQFPLALDTYQRPYVWSPQQVTQLLDDLRDFVKDQAQQVDYYMGTLLLHRDKKRPHTFVIDGQQRLTTLLILHYRLTKTLPTGQEFEFASSKSARNICRAQAALDDDAANLGEPEELFSRIRFTMVVVREEDLAFAFFDTQNHRGIPPKATDLLKAYHLRAIRGGPDDRMLQTECAKRWERMQRLRRIYGYEGDLAPVLFEKLLWRARRWRGQKRLRTEDHDAIIDEFKTRSLSSPTPDAVPLYPTRLNTLASSLHLQGPGQLRIILHGLDLGGEAINLPFAIRQPISRGLGFFLYADKYAALAEALLRPGNEAPAPAFRDFYQAVMTGMSIHLREFFLLAGTMFADRFGFAQLYSFGLWLDFVLGRIRMHQSRIDKATPRVYLSDSPQNLLDLIATAYTPEEVIDALRNDPDADRIYAADEPGPRPGVQGIYRKGVLAYYGKGGSLAGKRQWIEERSGDQRA